MTDPLSAGPAGLPLLVFALLWAGLCALSRAALEGARKSRLRTLLQEAEEEKNEKKRRLYEKALRAAEDPRLPAALRLGSRFAQVFAGAFFALFVFFHFETIEKAGLAAGLSALAAAVALSFFPALLGEAAASIVAAASAGALGFDWEAFLLPLLPVIRLTAFFDTPFRALSRGFSVKKNTPAAAVTGEELLVALKEGEKSGAVEGRERSMVEGVFYLGDRPVGTFMTHRSEVVWLEAEAGAEEARRAALEHGEQRYFPVAPGSLDQVTGIVSAQDILKALLENTWAGLPALSRRPFFIPETMPAIRAFEAFRKGSVEALLVMDEYGGLSGLLLVRDLLEAIVGELSASGEEEPGLLAQEDGSFLADGSLNIDEAAEALGLEVGEHQEYHTLAGFVLELSGEIPRTGAEFDWQGFRFKVVDMDGNRIDKLLISRRP